MDENESRKPTDESEVDSRRALWRRGSYEIVGDWLRPASVAILDRLEEVMDRPLAGCHLLDVATGTGAVAIEAALRGATVAGVDITDEFIEVARRRAEAVGATVRWEIGDFDRLDQAIGSGSFDVVTSSFGVIFAPDAGATAASLLDRIGPGGWLAVTAWDPRGVFVVPEAMLELFPERPAMPRMEPWAGGIESLFEHLPARLVLHRTAVLGIEFESVSDCAEQLERWAGGWASLFEHLDRVGTGAEARARFAAHLRSFATAGESFVLDAAYHTSVFQRHLDE